MTTPCSTAMNHNFNCVIKASLELINLPLIDILADHVKDVDLFKKINSCSALLSGRNQLRTDQRKVCFLTPPATPDYRQFDVTLLYKLIRNLCPLLRPTQGWGNEPQPTDTQLGDDIERLRLFRNTYYAHAVSKSISDTQFDILWKDLKSVIMRIQSKCQTICSVSYERELIAIENFKFTHGYLKKCEILLEAFLKLQTDERDEPEVVIKGNDEVLCGDLARFEAVLKPDSSCWSITWQKRRGKVTETIDTSTKKFSGSTNRKLVIQSVCKEDEGEYQVELSHKSNGDKYSKCGNTICLHVFGEVPYLNDLRVTTGDERIIIQYEVSGQSPQVQRIEWKKDGHVLNTNACKYTGGSINDSSLTIRFPTEKDKGKYSCIISNAVGSVSKDVMLDVPSIDIEVNPTVYFGSNATITAVVSSTPPPEQVLWQKSKDGNNFHCIDIRKPKYYGSNAIPFKPLLVIPKATFDDKLNYRLLVRNKIRESISETVHLNVTGSPPNIMTSHETNIKCKLLKLVGNVFLYDGSPDILEVFWTKNGEKIDTQGSGGRLSEVTIDNPSLIIRDVNVDDAGNYQLTAVNAVGSTTSNVITLDVPGVSYEKTENKEDDTQRFVVTIQSVPSPLFVQWSSKGQNEDVYKPIDCNGEDYKGTIVTIPHPVLVGKKSHLENYNYQIEVTNFFGCTVKQISDNQHHPTENVTKENKVYKDRDAGIKFAKLSNYLAKHFPHQEFQSLKLILLASEKVKNVSALKSASSASECFTILHEENLFTQKDVIFMQFLCKETGCEELYSQCIEYAVTNKALCYFEKPPDNGYKKVQFHVQGNLNDYTKEQIEHIVEAVADIVECETQDISVNGVKPSNSFFLVLSLKEVYTWKLSKLNEQDCHRLTNLNIDFFIVDFKTIFLQSVKGRSPICTTTKEMQHFSKCTKLQTCAVFCPNSTLSIQNEGRVSETDRDTKGKIILDLNSSLEKRGNSKRDKKSQVYIGIDQHHDKPFTSIDEQLLDKESSLKSLSLSPFAGSMVDSAEVEIPHKVDDKNHTLETSHVHENSAMVSDQRSLLVRKRSTPCSNCVRSILRRRRQARLSARNLNTKDNSLQIDSKRTLDSSGELQRQQQSSSVQADRGLFELNEREKAKKRKHSEGFGLDKITTPKRHKQLVFRDDPLGFSIGHPQDKPFTSSDEQHLDKESSLKSLSLSPFAGSMVDSAEVEIPHKVDDKNHILETSHVHENSMVSDQRSHLVRKRSTPCSSCVRRRRQARLSARNLNTKSCPSNKWVYYRRKDNSLQIHSKGTLDSSGELQRQQQSSSVQADRGLFELNEREKAKKRKHSEGFGLDKITTPNKYSPFGGSMIDSAEVEIPLKVDDKNHTLESFMDSLFKLQNIPPVHFVDSSVDSAEDGSLYNLEDKIPTYVVKKINKKSQ